MTQINQKNSLESPFLLINDTLSKNIKLIATPCNMQVGIIDNPSDLTLTGRLSLSCGIYELNSNNVNVQIENHISVAILKSQPATTYDPRPTYFSVYLPSGCRSGQVMTIKDFSGVASLIPIRIFDQNELTIDGADYKTISTQYGSLNLVWNENWFVV